jgi:hypothetical protein
MSADRMRAELESYADALSNVYAQDGAYAAQKQFTIGILATVGTVGLGAPALAALGRAGNASELAANAYYTAGAALTGAYFSGQALGAAANEFALGNDAQGTKLLIGGLAGTAGSLQAGFSLSNALPPVAPENASGNIIQQGALDWSRVNPQGQAAYDHVLDHGVDNPNKPLQGVFTNDPVLTTEQAWAQGQLQGIQPTPQTNGNLKFVVPMGGPVGWQGGFNGTGAPLSSVRIVVNALNQVVTSFPE